MEKQLPITNAILKRTLLALAVIYSLCSATWAAVFAKGGDVGWLRQMEAKNINFYDDYGTQKDCLQILKDNGMDTIRLRVWVNPSNNPVNGHCSKNEVVAMAVRAKNLGMRVMIDFHYSDSWADPDKQNKPAAWANHSFSRLLTDVYNHTYDVVSACVANGVTPEWVQIGNEIRNGMLWPDGDTKHFSQMTQLINKGYDAVKAVNTNIKVVVHLDRGNDNATFRWFFDSIKTYGAKYDVIGMSYYPYWLGSDYTATINDLGRNLQDMSARYKKEVMVVEVGGVYQKGPNTSQLLTAVIAKVRAVRNAKGLGVIYWEPEGTKSFSNGYSMGCWNESGTPNVALSAFQEQNGPTIATGIYSVQNRANSKMLDNMGSTADGSNVCQWADGISDNQKWFVSYSDGYYRLTCLTNGKYLNSLEHTAKDSMAWQRDNGGGSQQQFTLEAQGGGYYKIINLANGKALDNSASTTNGTPLTFRYSNASWNQQWQFVAP